MILREAGPARLAAALLFLAVVAAAARPDPRLANPHVGSVFVAYEPVAPGGEVSISAAASAEAAFVAARVVPLATGGAAGTLPLRPGETAQAAASRYRRVPGVKFAAPNLWAYKMDGSSGSSRYSPQMYPFEAPTDPGWPDSWAYQRTSAGYAWGRNVKGLSHNTVPGLGKGMETRVCIIDSGVDCGHPDLRANGKSFCADGAAFINGTRRLGLQYAQDDNGHGTYMAGLVAAAGNGIGMMGMLPRGSALYVCKFMDASGFGAIADAYRCLDWCISKKVPLSVAAWGTNIGGMDWQGPNTEGGLYWKFRRLLQSAGQRHLMVAAAGNHGRELLTQGRCPAFFFLPAQMQLDNLLVVGASDKSDNIWRVTPDVAASRKIGHGGDAGCPPPVIDAPQGSNYGSDWVDVAAPGVLVYTTAMRSAADKAKGLAPYTQVSGTSVATALVGGAAGLILSATANEAASEMADVRESIRQGADAVGTLAARLADGQQLVGGGRRLNAYNGLAVFLGGGLPLLPSWLCGVLPPGMALDVAPQPPPPKPPPPRPPPPNPRPPKPLPPRPRPPKPAPRPPPPSCREGLYWTGKACAVCTGRFGPYCVTCDAKRCTLRCTPNDLRAACTSNKARG